MPRISKKHARGFLTRNKLCNVWQKSHRKGGRKKDGKGRYDRAISNWEDVQQQITSSIFQSFSILQPRDHWTFNYFNNSLYLEKLIQITIVKFTYRTLNISWRSLLFYTLNLYIIFVYFHLSKLVNYFSLIFFSSNRQRTKKKCLTNRKSIWWNGNENQFSMHTKH